MMSARIYTLMRICAVSSADTCSHGARFGRLSPVWRPHHDGRNHDVLSRLASVLDMDAEAILAQSLHDFVAEQIALSQQRMSQGYMEHQRFLQKYGMPWEGLCGPWRHWRSSRRKR